MQALGVADEGIASGYQLLGQLLQNSLLRRAIEVNDHIATEDDVRFLGEAEVGVHEIQTPKLNLPAQLRDHAKQLGIGVAAPHEVPSAQVCRHRTHSLCTEDAQHGLGQHGGGDIGGQYLKAKTGTRLAKFLQHHGQRVSLLTRGATGAPDEQRTSALVTRHKIWKRFLGQIVKMVRLAKEICLVGGDHVDELNDLFLLSPPLEELLAIRVIRIQI